MPLVELKDDVCWRGVLYTVNRQPLYNADGNLIQHPVPTKVEIPADLAKILSDVSPLKPK